jgi:hypothetical protein
MFIIKKLKSKKSLIRNFIIGFLFVYPISLFSQPNKVDKILEKIQENDIKKAIDLRDKLNDETPSVLRNYVNHLIYNDVTFLGRNVDSSYNYLRIVLAECKSLENNLKNEYCARFKLCENEIYFVKEKLEKEAFLFYSKDSNIVSLKYFIEHFDNTVLQKKTKELIENVEFNEATKMNTIEGYKAFLIRYPSSPFKNDVNKRWEDLSFKECLQKNDEGSYRYFLSAFPYGTNLIQAKVNLGKIIYEKAMKSEKIIDYNTFMNEFSHQETISGLRTEVENIQSKFCHLSFIKIKYSTSLDSLRDFLWDFEDCKYADSIRLKIELIEYNNLITVFSVETANDFLKSYPESPFKNDVLSKLFELEYSIIDGEEDNNKIDVFRKKYQDINVNEKLSMIGNPNVYSSTLNWNKTFGFIDPLDSNIVIYPMFEEVRGFSNGMAAVKFNNLWGFIDKKGNVVIDIIFEEVRDFHDGLAGVKQNGLWQIINKLNIPISNQKYQNVGIYNSGLINVSTLTSGWVFISQTGQIKSQEVSYLSASSFSSGYAFVQEGSRYFIIDINFNKIFEVDYNSPLYNNYTIYDACSGFEVNNTSRILCSYYERRNPYSIIKYGDVLLLNDGLVYDIKRNKCWFSEYIYFDKEILVYGNRRTERTEQAMLFIYSDNLNVQSIKINQYSDGNTPDIGISRVKNNIELYYDRHTKYSIPIQSMIPIQPNKYTLVINEGEYHYEDKDKSVLGNKMDYSYATDFVNGKAIVGVSNKFLLIDTNTNQIGDVYDKLDRINTNLFVACLNGTCFLMDLNGNYLSKGYEFIDTRIYNGAIIVALSNLKGYIDIEGKEIIKPQFADARGFSNGKAIVTVSYGNANCYSWDCKGTRIIDKKGNKLSGDFKNTLEYNPRMRF